VLQIPQAECRLRVVSHRSFLCVTNVRSGTETAVQPGFAAMPRRRSLSGHKPTFVSSAKPAFERSTYLYALRLRCASVTCQMCEVASRALVRGRRVFQSRQIRQCLRESLAYPRWMADAEINRGSCPHGGYFDSWDRKCRHCSKETECRWVNSLDGGIDASGMSAGELIEALNIAIGFVGHHEARHDRQACDCQACSWLRDTRHLIKRYRRRSVKMV
jgi:hypothetical protein